MLVYKIDVLAELKKRGYTTYVLRQKKFLSETALTAIRKGEPISMQALEAVCAMLRMQPGDIVESTITDEDKIKFFI